jgi:hypothetical protein
LQKCIEPGEQAAYIKAHPKSAKAQQAKKKATKQDADSDMYAQDTWDRYGYDSGVGDENPPSDAEMRDEDPPGKSSGVDDDPFDNLDYMYGDEDEDDLEDPAGGRGDAWMYGPTDDEKERPLGGSKKRPGGKEAEAAYHQADRMMKKYAGVDIKRAEYWAKEKKKAADAMLPEHSFAEMFKRMENR